MAGAAQITTHGPSPMLSRSPHATHSSPVIYVHWSASHSTLHCSDKANEYVKMELPSWQRTSTYSHRQTSYSSTPLRTAAHHDDPSASGLPLDLSVSRMFPFLEEQIAAEVALFNLRIAIGAKSTVVWSYSSVELWQKMVGVFGCNRFGGDIDGGCIEGWHQTGCVRVIMQGRQWLNKE